MRMLFEACLKLWLHTFGHDDVSDKDLEAKMKASDAGMGRSSSYPWQASFAGW